MRAIIENMNSPDYVLYTPSFGNLQGTIKILDIWKITNYNNVGGQEGYIGKTKGRSGFLLRRNTRFTYASPR